MPESSDGPGADADKLTGAKAQRGKDNAKWLLLGFLIVGSAVAILMIGMANTALEMSDDAKTLNHLMYRQTLACAQRENIKPCQNATRDLKGFRDKMTGSVKASGNK